MPLVHVIAVGDLGSLFNLLDYSARLNNTPRVRQGTTRDVFIIDDLETLRLLAHPTRAAIVELLVEPRTVTQLASTLDVPRTRLYHHIELLVEKGLIRAVEERRVGALTERVYAATASEYRTGARLLKSGDEAERIDAITTLLFDTTKADVVRSLTSRASDLEAQDERRLGLGRTIAYLTFEQAAEFVEELEALVARFDGAHQLSSETRPFALVWALYPSSRVIA